MSKYNPELHSLYNFSMNISDVELKTDTKFSRILKWNAGVIAFLCDFHFDPENIHLFYSLASQCPVGGRRLL